MVLEQASVTECLKKRRQIVLSRTAAVDDDINISAATDEHNDNVSAETTAAVGDDNIVSSGPAVDNVSAGAAVDDTSSGATMDNGMSAGLAVDT